jgi:N-acetylmuramoyl-L-alanine amidase
MGAKVDWNSTTLVVTATKGDITVILPLNSRTPTVNGIVYILDVPAKIVNNRTLAPLRFVGEAFGSKVTWDAKTGNINISNSEPTTNPPGTQPREIIVVLDAGHGGRDPGARGNQLIEKDVNLEIALKTGELLKQRGIRVEYTRNDDSFIGLEERSNIANNLNATLFVSIHNNANLLSTPNGTETYFYAPQGIPDLFVQRDERARLAKALQNQLVDKLQRKNRGVIEANFSVLRNTYMPSALVEVAFISNPTEEALLQTKDFKDRAAEAIANGILSFLNK